MTTQFSYMVVKFNNPYFAQESTLLGNKYRKTAKFAVFNYSVHKDGSESLNFIKYSNDIIELQNQIKDFESWYNYPIGVAKNRKGELFSID